jgi:hypothetical protein
VALFESEDGFDWRLSDSPIGFLRGLTLTGGERIELAYMERPQIYFENGEPKVLLCACMREEDHATHAHSFNVRIALRDPQ